MSRAIVVCWHKYTPFGSEFYEPILSFFLQQMEKYKDEYDHIYILDSTWNIPNKPLPDTFFRKEFDGKITLIKVDPNLRYYEAYQQVLPEIKEDLILFLDNDSVIYQEGVIKSIFNKLSEFDVVSIIDQIGFYPVKELKNGNKFCPYLFAASKDLLMKYKDIYWGSDMPEHETLGFLTKRMLEDDVLVYEFPEDKSNCLFDGTQEGEKSKRTGFYHIRAGSTPAYLLATKKYGERLTYDDYLKNQPRSEYLRQAAWYWCMSDQAKINLIPLLDDCEITQAQWIVDYIPRFKKYHGLD